jgi:hypothetical protein
VFPVTGAVRAYRDYVGATLSQKNARHVLPSSELFSAPRSVRPIRKRCAQENTGT